MKKILINGKSVEVGPETLQRIKKVARSRKISVSRAISFCLKKVI